MLSKDEVLNAVKNGRESGCLDSRDYSRLLCFFPASDWGHFGFEFPTSAPPEPPPWELATIVERMKHDVEFAFEKALNRRGISAGFMYEVVKMWLWILQEDELAKIEYPMYGLPLYKAVAEKYGFPVPEELDGKTGREDCFNE